MRARPATVLVLLPLAGCVAAPPSVLPPPVLSPPPAASTLSPGAQDPSLARNAALDGFAAGMPDASRVSQHIVALPGGSVPVSNLTLPDAVFFDFGVATPRPDAGPALDALAHAITSSPPGSKLTIAGNTDSIGTASANQALSEARARAVVAALAERGIDPSRLDAIGFGAARPIAPNATDEGRALNRRVELALSPSFAANAASLTELVPVRPVAPAPLPSLARKPAPLDVHPNRLAPVEPNDLGPPVTY